MAFDPAHVQEGLCLKFVRSGTRRLYSGDVVDFRHGAGVDAPDGGGGRNGWTTRFSVFELSGKRKITLYKKNAIRGKIRSTVMDNFAMFLFLSDRSKDDIVVVLEQAELSLSRRHYIYLAPETRAPSFSS